MYGMAVLSLIGILYDDRVMWYEALALVCAYLLYVIGKISDVFLLKYRTPQIDFFSAMYCNDIIARKVRTIVSMLKRKSTVRPFREVSEIAPLLTKLGNTNGYFNGTNGNSKSERTHLYPVDSLEVIREDNEIGKWSGFGNFGGKNVAIYISFN